MSESNDNEIEVPNESEGADSRWGQIPIKSPTVSPRVMRLPMEPSMAAVPYPKPTKTAWKILIFRFCHNFGPIYSNEENAEHNGTHTHIMPLAWGLDNGSFRDAQIQTA